MKYLTTAALCLPLMACGADATPDKETPKTEDTKTENVKSESMAMSVANIEIGRVP